MTVASDVTNPLLGDSGAAATYGPQKGADPGRCAGSTRNLAHYADLLEAASGTVVRDVPGRRCRGRDDGRTAGHRRSLRIVRVRPGVEVVMELTGFDAALADVDLVLTGEGRVDDRRRSARQRPG